METFDEYLEREMTTWKAERDRTIDAELAARHGERAARYLRGDDEEEWKKPLSLTSPRAVVGAVKRTHSERQ